MAKASVYIETSLISYYVARPSRDLITAARQQITRDWWDTKRFNFDLYASVIVLDEAGAGDQTFATKRLAALAGIPVLNVSPASVQLADDLVRNHALPQKAAQDALHIAVAAVHGINYLLTWNCKHIANAQMRPAIEKTCQAAGYTPPILCTPEELS